MELQLNGRSVYVATANRSPDPAQKTVLFIHGTGQDHTIWTLPLRYFARHGRNVLAVDLPGHGRSGGEPLQSVDELADWAMAVLEATGLERTAIVGHSLGSLIALSAAARHSKHVRAIVLIGTTVPMRVTPELLEHARANRHEAIDMLNYWGYSQSAQLGGNENPGNWMVGSGQRLMEKARPGVIYADLRACDDYEKGLEHAAAVSCPALLILGERDRLTPPRTVGKLTAALPDAETVILPDCGHAMLSERPDPVLDQLIRIC